MKFTIFTSTIFLKIVMAITGIILVGFIFGHAMGNLQLFLGKDVFNSYAHFLQKGLGEFLWLIRITLIVSALLHILISVRLKLLNLSAKPNAYAVKSYLKSTLYSRTMIYTGILVGLFLIFHLLHFTVGNIMPDAYNQYENYGIMNLEVRHDAYSMVIGGFSNMWVSITYILAVVFLGFHLTHSIQSMLQTIGLGGLKATTIYIVISRAIGIIITLVFASGPIGVILGIIH